MTNRKALAIMSTAVLGIWLVTFVLEYIGVPDVRKLALVATLALAACMMGAFLHFLAKRLYKDKD